MKHGILVIFSILLVLTISDLANAAKPKRPIVKTSPVPKVPPKQILEFANLSDDELSPAGRSLEQDLLTAVSSFEKPVQLYHYFQAPTESNNPQQISSYFDDQSSRLQWVSYFLGFRTGAFWDPDNHVTELINAGPGMYLAIDPNASREYGDSAIILKVPAGYKYLSVFTPIALRKQTRDLLVQENIIYKVELNGGYAYLGLVRGFTGDALKNMVRPENTMFKKLVNKIFRRNQIRFIEYEYKSHLAGFCKTASQSAFVFVGDAPDSTEPNENGELLGKIPDDLNTAVLFSDLNFQNMTSEETETKDIITRFRNVLAGIREKGVNQTPQLMNEYLNDEEVNELAELSYRCERRY
jgi:hypothetical protein